MVVSDNMKAMIIGGAAKAFIAKNLTPRSGMTTEMREYIDILVSLENVVLNVRNTDGKRILLEYPVYESTKDGRNIVGIDVEMEYVEIVEM